MEKILPLPEKTSLVSDRALEEWKKLEFGLFIHWGLYALAGGVWKGEKIPLLGEQIQRHASIPRDEYARLATSFNPVEFNADEIADMAVSAGMKYVVFTAKHHDGFCMFHTKYSSFNIVDATPYGQDPLKELSRACSERDLKLGVYYSNPDWNYPGAVKRNPENSYAVFEKFTPDHLQYSLDQLEELLTHYGPLCEIFFDMGLPTVEDSRQLAEQVHRIQPDCLVSGRVMNNQGDYQTLPDNHLPEGSLDVPWETPCTLYHTWGYKSWIDRPPMDGQVERQAALYERVTSLGGNFLLNIGPLPDGSLHPYEKDVLHKLGQRVKSRDSLGGPDSIAAGIGSRGFYNTLQYNSNVPKTEFYGLIRGKGRGCRPVTLEYRLDGKDMALVLELDKETGRESYPLLLCGRGKESQGFSDGNEKGYDGAADDSTQSFVFDLKTPLGEGETPFRIIKDASAYNDESLWIWKEEDLKPPHQGTWCLNDDWTAHRKAMALYSMDGLEILSLS